MMSTSKINHEETYRPFLATKTARQWSRVGLNRRAGVATPLFSIYSKQSVGIGELPDIKLLVDWCREVGMSVIQLLPMNDVGFDFRPYDAQSSFALDPMYLRLSDLKETDLSEFTGDIDALRITFSISGTRVNYAIKSAKLDLLWKIFKKNQKKHNPSLEQYIEANRFWLSDYVLFQAIKERNQFRGWEAWDQDFRQKNIAMLWRFKTENTERLQFFEWLQWQLFEQFRAVKQYAEEKQILIMGDLPFLVARDSADVWAHQTYFKLSLAAGAPPDFFLSNGQRWGMPTYQWERIAQNDYDYLRAKLKYAQNFYHLFRLDHVVGLFRLWSIPTTEPFENAGLNGAFDPQDERIWEEHGRKILSVMAEETEMLPCAEDLGTVPECSYRVLSEFGIPGMDVQRWSRDWSASYDFVAPESYRKNSIATISTHDMSNLLAWWQFEAGTVEGELIRRKCAARGLSFDEVKQKLFDDAASRYGRLRWRAEIASVSAMLAALHQSEEEVSELVYLYRSSFDEKARFLKYLGLSPAEDVSAEIIIRRAFEMAHSAASVFSIQLLQDWLSLGGSLTEDPWDYRINFPGMTRNQNWTLMIPLPLEAMMTLEVNTRIREINLKANRI